MKRIIGGKQCTVEPGIFPSGGGKHSRGYAVYGKGGRLIGYAFRKADGWYCKGVACERGENFGGGLMKDAIQKMMKGGY